MIPFTFIIWCISIAAAFRRGSRWIRPSMFRWINALCDLAPGYFGLRVLWMTLQAWLEYNNGVPKR